MQILIIIGFNRIGFSKECKEIIEKIKDRFIDLAPVMMDDEASDYMQRNQEKKQKFKEEFEQKLTKEGFKFKFITPATEKDRSSAEADPFAHINEMDGILSKGLEEIQ